MRSESILDWFKQQQEESTMDARESEEPLVGQWEVDPNSPIPIERRDGKFFKVVNVNIGQAFDRETSEWGDQPMIKPSETTKIDDKDVNGIIVLFRNRTIERIKYLIQSKAEPGNATPGRVALAPTIQASASNMALNNINFLRDLNLSREHARCVIQPKDGGRFFEKNNLLAMQDIKNIKDIATEMPSNFIWTTREAIRELQQQGLVNEHLNEVLGVFS